MERSRRLEPWLAAAGALGVLVGIVAAALADQVLVPPRSARYRRSIVEARTDEIVLASDDETVRPGTYGIDWPGGHGTLGEVLEEGPSTVRRRLFSTSGQPPAPGPAELTEVDRGDPLGALGLSFDEVELALQAGQVPAWVVPGGGAEAESAGGGTWAVLLHGWGCERQSCLSYLPLLHRLGVTSVVPAYRNDRGAPPTRDGRCHLGALEWHEADAAMALAVASGALRIVLVGWSMGGEVALQAYARSPLRSYVTAMVLDSPVLDWRAVLTHLAGLRHVPRPVVALVMRVIELRAHLDLDDLDWVRRSEELAVPVLVVHGEEDPTVPYATSVALERARPDLVRLVNVERAGHIGAWNLDPERYESEVSSFLARAGCLG